MPLIESKLGAAETYVGGMTYKFERDRHGRFVCNVPRLSHAEMLVSAGTYQQIDPDEAAQTRPVAPEGDDDDTLLVGSGTHPHEFEIEGETVKLGDIVRHAKSESQLSADAWNGMPDAYREALIDVALDDLGYEESPVKNEAPPKDPPKSTKPSSIAPQDDDEGEEDGKEETPPAKPAAKPAGNRQARPKASSKTKTGQRKPPQPRKK